jgi:L-gulono-1,4-lactone dehydrogenase
VTRWKNWAGNQQAAPVRVVAPRSVEEVAAVVTASAAAGVPVKAVGSGHSFTGAAVTVGTHVRPEGMTSIRSLDPDTGLVTVEHGMPLHALSDALDQQGLALTNMGDINVQTVMGAISTSTHGTGRDSAGLSAFVRGLEIVLADGSVVTCGPGDDLFEAARVSVGSLGVVTAVTLQTEPSFLLRAREEPMRWDEVLDSFDAFCADNEHWEFYWFPHSEGCQVKRNNRSDGPAEPLSDLRRWWDDEFLSNSLFGAVNRLGRAAPRLVPYVNKVSARALSAREYVTRSYEVFATPRRVRFYEMEYAVPRSAAVALLRDLRALIEASHWLISFPIEVRVAPADDVWLSTSHGRDTVYIACHVFERTDKDPYFREVEALMTGYLGRPHWGKLHTRSAEDLAPLYPRWSDWQAVRNRVDPDRVFANDYTRQVFGE